MAINRRQFLIGAGGLAAAATTMGLGACAPGSQGGGSQAGGQEGGATNLALAWWGNPTRNKNTEAMIDAYMQANPNVKIDTGTSWPPRRPAAKPPTSFRWT
jgi:ABC-type glycerol-3-phosphate transport system substrate-binding protein